MDKGAVTPTVMVVDDTPANLRLMQDMLELQGYRVLAFPDGALALKAAARNQPDLIMLDINMPGMSGYEVCEHLKADARLQNIPVIFLSALNELPDKIKAFTVGGVDYITKPFQLAEVQARVNTHLTLHRLQHELERANHQLEALVQAKVREISESQMATIFALAKLAESRDDDTGTHLERVQTFCRLLSEHLRDHSSYREHVDNAFIENVYYASPLHDIGKVGIPDSILLKTGKLTEQEFELMKQHTVIGAQTLVAVQREYPRNSFVRVGIAIANSHHERWDGAGYPAGLAGENIPLSARIMAVADVYDALRSLRCYKDAFTHEKSRDIILRERGKHFDPVIVDAFAVLEEEFNRIRTAKDDL